MKPSEELNKGYEFTKAHIAELESLRAENERLKFQIGIHQRGLQGSERRLLAENETLRARLAELKRQLEEASKGALVCANRILQQEQKIGELRQQLAESQAREARRVDALKFLDMRIITTDLGGVVEKALTLPHDDTALKEYHDSIVEKCAVIAGNSCLVPPDGGSPTAEEAAVSEEAARRIRELKSNQ